MGLMDKVKQGAGTALNKAQQGVNQGKAKIDQAQSKRQWDGLLHNLGAAMWAQQREGGSSDAVTAAWAALDEHLAANGPIEAEAGTPETGAGEASTYGSSTSGGPAPTTRRAYGPAPPVAAVARLATALIAAALLAASCGGAKATAIDARASRLIGTWAAGPAFPAEGSDEVPAIFSCGSANFCVTMDDEGEGTWAYRAGDWKFDREAGPSGGLGTITGLQCFADGTCTATDAEAEVITYKDGKWAAKPGPTPNGGGPMGCASPTLCLFVDGVGQSYTWNGKTFSKPRVAYPSLANTMGSGAGYIACASGSTFCVVADELGYLGTYVGGHWGPLARPFGLITPLGAACLSPTECITPFHLRDGPARGDWAVWDGSHWNATAGGAHGFPYADAQMGQTMSCALGFCMGLDNQRGSGFVGYAYNGKTWSKTSLFGNGTKLPSLVSCASAKWCMALYIPSQGTSPGPSWVFHIAA